MASKLKPENNFWVFFFFFLGSFSAGESATRLQFHITTLNDLAFIAARDKKTSMMLASAIKSFTSLVAQKARNRT